VDEVLSATVLRTLQHGVIVQTQRGEGLVPLRELGLPPGADHRRAFQAGRQFDVVVVSQGGGRLTFSATQVARVEERKNYRDFASTGTVTGASALGSLGDVLRTKLGHAAPTAPPSQPEPAAGRAAVPEPPAPRNGTAAAPLPLEKQRADVVRRRR
jgi:hypothetical protein